MDTLTADTFEEARRQLFDPTIEEDDIRQAEAKIRQAEAMRSQAGENTDSSTFLTALEDKIASQRKWIRTLREIQGVKMKRQAGFRKIV